MIRSALCLCLLLLVLLSELAYSVPLRVGVVGAPPFVMPNRLGRPVGFAVDVWQIVAGQQGVAYDLISVGSKEEAIDQLVAGKLDVLIGDLALTSERAARVDFTVPFFHSTLGIVSPTRQTGMFERLENLATPEALLALAGLCLVPLSLGILLWLFERRAGGDFPSDAKQGIGEGIWLALVTISTVGYGDRVPRTPQGRFLICLCMLIATLGLSSLTATIASVLTVSKMASPTLNSVHDLPGHRVAVVSGSPAVDFVRLHGARPIRVKGVEEAIRAVVNGKADAAMDGYPLLGYHVIQDPQLPVKLYRSFGLLQDYSFALARGNPLLPQFNVTLLHLREQGRFSDVERVWFNDAYPAK